MIYFVAAFRTPAKKVDIFFCWVLCMLKPPQEYLSDEFMWTTRHIFLCFTCVTIEITITENKQYRIELLILYPKDCNLMEVSRIILGCEGVKYLKGWILLLSCRHCRNKNTASFFQCRFCPFVVGYYTMFAPSQHWEVILSLLPQKNWQASGKWTCQFSIFPCFHC